MSQVYYRNRHGAYEYDPYVLAYASRPIPWTVLALAVLCWRANVALAGRASSHDCWPVYTSWLRPYRTSLFLRLAALLLYTAVLGVQGVAAAWVLTTWWRWAVKMAARWPLWANSTLAGQGAYTFAAVGMLLIGLALAEWAGKMIVVQVRCMWELASTDRAPQSQAASKPAAKVEGSMNEDKKTE